MSETEPMHGVNVTIDSPSAIDYDAMALQSDIDELNWHKIIARYTSHTMQVTPSGYRGTATSC